MWQAGNVNNVLFNERIKGKYALLLDNDMKPKRNLLTRMLPWFYTWVEDKARYYHNKAIAFTQAPQHFKWETTGPEDILGGRNSIFFAAIQRGRDGFESCAFAGTNAIFRIGALKSVQGALHAVAARLTSSETLLVHLQDPTLRRTPIREPDGGCAAWHEFARLRILLHLRRR